MKINLETIFRLLIPKYYNRLTWYLIGGVAVPLLSCPLWINFVNIVLEECQYPIIKMESNIIAGLIVLISSLTYNVCSRYIEYKKSNTNEPAYMNVHQENFVDFASMCQAILPILKDNEYIFKHTGPNSSADECGEWRMDLSLWEKFKRDSIIPNNAKISQIITKNIHLIPHSYRTIFEELNIHIKSFEAHINDSNVNYTEHQFPKEIVNIIEETCFSEATKNKTFDKTYKWLSRRLKKDKIKTACIIGSFLFYPEQARDVDIAIYTYKEFKALNLLKFDFKIKFGKALHISYFERDMDYIIFCKKNKFKIDI